MLLSLQDLKNAMTSMKKIAKSLEKEREKLSELEATPDRLAKEVRDLEKKVKILKVSTLINI